MLLLLRVDGAAGGTTTKAPVQTMARAARRKNRAAPAAGRAAAGAGIVMGRQEDKQASKTSRVPAVICEMCCVSMSIDRSGRPIG